MTSTEHWRPIPDFDGYEMSNTGRVRRTQDVRPAPDGTVALHGPEGRRYRSVRRLLAEVWPAAEPAPQAPPEPQPERFPKETKVSPVEARAILGRVG